MTEYEKQRHERYNSRAAFYGLWLRQQGFDADEAAAFVAERYPAVRHYVAGLLRQAERRREFEERYSVAAGGAA